MNYIAVVCLVLLSAGCKTKVELPEIKLVHECKAERIITENVKKVYFLEDTVQYKPDLPKMRRIYFNKDSIVSDEYKNKTLYLIRQEDQDILKVLILETDEIANFNIGHFTYSSVGDLFK